MKYFKFILQKIWLIYTIVFLFFNAVCIYTVIVNPQAWYVLIPMIILDAAFFYFSIDAYKISKMPSPGLNIGFTAISLLMMIGVLALSFGILLYEKYH